MFWTAPRSPLTTLDCEVQPLTLITDIHESAKYCINDMANSRQDWNRRQSPFENAERWASREEHFRRQGEFFFDSIGTDGPVEAGLTRQIKSRESKILEIGKRRDDLDRTFQGTRDSIPFPYNLPQDRCRGNLMNQRSANQYILRHPELRFRGDYLHLETHDSQEFCASTLPTQDQEPQVGILADYRNILPLPDCDGKRPGMTRPFTQINPDGSEFYFPAQPIRPPPRSHHVSDAKPTLEFFFSNPTQKRRATVNVIGWKPKESDERFYTRKRQRRSSGKREELEPPDPSREASRDPQELEIASTLLNLQGSSGECSAENGSGHEVFSTFEHTVQPRLRGAYIRRD